MRMKLRNEGYQSRLAFLQSGFLILQKFSLQLLSLSFNSTQSTKTESLPSSSQTLWSSVPSHHLYTHPALSHILEIVNGSPENDDTSAPMTPGYKVPPSFIECLMLIRMLVTTFKTGLNAMIKITRSLVFSHMNPLSFNPSLTKPLCAHWGLMASGALMTCSSRTGSHLFPCCWVCTPELALLLLTTDSRSSPLSILAAPYFPLPVTSLLSSLHPSFLNSSKTSYSSTDITPKKEPPLLWPFSPTSITLTPR